MKVEIELKDVIRNRPRQKRPYLLCDTDGNITVAVYENVPCIIDGRQGMSGLRWFDLASSKIIEHPYAFAEMKGVFDKAQLKRMKGNEEKADRKLEEMRPIREAHNEKHYRYVKVRDRIVEVPTGE